MKVQSSASTAHWEQQAACSHAPSNELIGNDSCVFKTCHHGGINGTTAAFAAGSNSNGNVCERSNSSRDLEQLMKHAEDISAELSALLPEAGLGDAVLHTKAVTAAESDLAAAADVNSSTAAPTAAADVAGIAEAGASEGFGFYCDHPPLPLQLPLHVSSSSSTLRSAEQHRDVTDSVRNRLAAAAAASSYQGPWEIRCSGVTPQHHELLVRTQSDLANSSRSSSSSSSSSGASSISTLTPGVPGIDSIASSGRGSGTTLNRELAKLMAAAAACKSQQQQQQLIAHARRIAAEHVTAGGSQAAVSRQVAAVHTHRSQDPHAAMLAAATAGLPCVRVVTPAQTAMRQQQRQQSGLIRQQSSIFIRSRPGTQPAAPVPSQQQTTPATALAARAAVVANMHQRALFSRSAAAGFAEGPPLSGSPLGGSPLGWRKRRSSDSTQFDVAWPCQQQQQQEQGSYEPSANCSGASKIESGAATPASKKAKIDAQGLLTRMSAVVASVYGATAAQRAVTAAHAELRRHGYIEAN